MAQPDKAGRAIAKLIGVSDDAPQYIRAFHGSPYDWDKVDMSMVGKGEGPLLEGFGLYATDDWSQGNWYRHRTARIARDRLASQMRAARALSAAGDPAAEAAMRSVYEVASKLARNQPHGRLYELEVDADPDSLLRFDRTLAAHPPAVRDRLRAVGEELYDPQLTGQQFYTALSGGTPFDLPPPSMQRAASQKLFSAGVPGHRYEHGGNNYVLYPGTEDSIRILRKYGVLAPIPVAGAVGASVGGQPDGRD